MKSLQPFLQTRAFEHFWALLLIANEVESSRSLLFSILKAESLLLSLIDVEVIYQKDTKLSKLFTIYISLWLQRRLRRNRFFLPIGKFFPV